QAVGERPGVLREQADVLLGEAGGHVVQVAAARGEQLVTARTAGAVVGDRVEGVHAVDAAAEQVVDLVRLVIGAELDGVLAQEQVAGEEAVPGLGLEDVGLGVLFGAEVQGAAAHAHADGRQVELRVANGRVVAVGDLGFGGEVVGPVAEQLRGVGLELEVLHVVVRAQRQRV
ncbi:hypothetical protein CATMIT_01638, partial [Catenibacterium mitsuokai DSM 15897]